MKQIKIFLILTLTIIHSTFLFSYTVEPYAKNEGEVLTTVIDDSLFSKKYPSAMIYSYSLDGMYSIYHHDDPDVSIENKDYWNKIIKKNRLIPLKILSKFCIKIPFKYKGEQHVYTGFFYKIIQDFHQIKTKTTLNWKVYNAPGKLKSEYSKRYSSNNFKYLEFKIVNNENKLNYALFRIKILLLDYNDLVYFVDTATFEIVTGKNKIHKIEGIEAIFDFAYFMISEILKEEM